MSLCPRFGAHHVCSLHPLWQSRRKVYSANTLPTLLDKVKLDLLRIAKVTSDIANNILGLIIIGLQFAVLFD